MYVTIYLNYFLNFFLKIKKKTYCKKKKKKTHVFIKKSYLPCYNFFFLNVYIYKSNILQINFFLNILKFIQKKKKLNRYILQFI